MNSWVKEGILLVYPEACIICKKDLIGGREHLCSVCEGRIICISGTVCHGCSRMLADGAGELCSECGDRKYFYSRCYALGEYDAILRELIHIVKYKKKKEVLRVLVPYMEAFFKQHSFSESIDVIIPVPMHWYHYLCRGFNQSHVIASLAGKILDKPVLKKALFKKKYTGSQVSKGRSDRLTSLIGSIVPGKKDQFKSKRVLLIDDVYTTGASVNECSKILMGNGASSVTVFVLARG